MKETPILFTPANIRAILEVVENLTTLLALADVANRKGGGEGFKLLLLVFVGSHTAP